MDAIQELRIKWNSSLPVAVAHCDELSHSSSVKLLTLSYVSIFNICKRPITRAYSKKLRSFYCKAAALCLSPFEDTLMFDVDTVWFKNPELLFNAPGYLKSGALFFRDRFVFQLQHGQKRDGLFQLEVEELIKKESNYLWNPIKLQSLSNRKNNLSLFWRNTNNRTLPGLQHIQESSVVMLQKSSHINTLSIIARLLPNYQQGYGDKEIYWIAATIANENYSFEPYLFGTYGDCGAVFHYDPTDLNPKTTSMFFMNAEYLLEHIDAPGDQLQRLVSRPVLVHRKTQLFDMNVFDTRTRGRCGGCLYMGCVRVPPFVNETLYNAQIRRLQIMTKTSTSFFSWKY